jgi:hypothetical protein
MTILAHNPAGSEVKLDLPLSVFTSSTLHKAMTEVPRVFESQVAGHKGGITTDESGALLIKSTSQRELDFYDVLAPALVPGFVGKWTPRFFGTLALHGQVKPGSGAVLSPGQVSQLQPKDGHTVSQPFDCLFRLNDGRPWCWRT